MAIAVNIFVKNNQMVPVAISGVTVNVYNPSTMALIATATTDVNGRAAFLIPGATYEVRFYKLGVTFQNPKSIIVLEPVSPPDTNDFDMQGIPTIVAISSDPRICRATGVFVDFANRPVANALLRIMAVGESGFQSPKVVDARLVSPSVAEYHTDVNGRVTVDLFRKGRFYVTFSGEDETVWSIIVPDSSSINLIDLIHPQPVSLTYDQSVVPSNAATIAIGQNLLVPFTVLFSDGEEITEDLGKWITFTDSDGDIASVGFVSNSTTSKLSILGLTTGVITVTVAANQVLPMRIPAYSVSAATLTITVS